MKKEFRVVKNFKIVKRPCFLNRYYRVIGEAFLKKILAKQNIPNFINHG